MFWAVNRAALKRCCAAVQDKYGAYQTHPSFPGTPAHLDVSLHELHEQEEGGVL